MTLNLTVPPQHHADFSPKITVIGVGGGGTNAVDNMILADLKGVEFVVANTDAQQLSSSRADRRIQLGPHLTQGLGAGAKPEIGRAAAEEAADELSRHLEGSHMVFVTAGMGGGTGTGAAPIVARMARERGILTVGVVTKPFSFEGPRRAKAAEEGIAELQQYVDTLIVIPNQNLFRMANERTTYKDAFKMADNVLYMGVRGVTDLMVAPGLVNLDFADIRTVMAEMGKAMMGTGEAEGEDRARLAAEAAISNPLLEDTSMSGARGLLINITGGDDLTLFEVDQAANRIREEVAEDANIIFGSAIDPDLDGKIRVSVVATGIDMPSSKAQQEAEEQAAAQQHDEQAAAANIVQNAPQTGGQPPMFGGGMQPVRNAPPAGHPNGVPAGQAPRQTPNFSQQPAPGQSAHSGAAQRPASPRDGLFTSNTRSPAPAPRAPEPAPSRGSLFGLMTGVLRRPAADPREVRQEPAPQVTPAPRNEQQDGPTVRPAQGDDGLDIPAFMRRPS
ncbi:cell division protein FtsZ [Acetobacter sp.]|jgi:cell division protein FtsZ|uniref:cell division protein FtsZ n=1 Tax=Acetobacter sp. TaxID=440 RepID=UPI0025BCECAD|nr:cell division protein FtsZ [Acetobacter sp.]MCH4089813.1 cell division protein FtsZ [Acetobacter sp.]MCI1298509.1 cell division protein FtsZ [Acetobacter sp.]MCI1315074.1 cell division protein FtsZ [Acetobacter sp.]